MAENQDKRQSVFKAAAIAPDTDVDIEAYRDPRDGGRLILFKASFISHISDLEDGISLITLHDGIKIPAKMDPRLLRDKIYKRDFRAGDDAVNLLPVTGFEAFPRPLMPEHMEIGELVKGQGVYVGKHVNLGKVFNIFAAPEDISPVLQYDEMVDFVANLKNWHHYDGAAYKNEMEFYTALQNGTYGGEWIIPPRAILDPEDTQADSLVKYKNEGSLKDTFRSVGQDSGSIRYYPSFYWTSTEQADNQKRVWISRLVSTGKGWDLKDNYKFSCRPVRLVEFKP